ncbi:Uncharacterised protein [Candidatus Ornithobacterium hominis]|uniref:Uncharacterized protein n=1 Tax=Candidatus Ornithobacterium hominis TaxID=2497989 RepID=A0A383U0T1_9FLAO|nr:hypothetical protein [Candidatus Ornithobacterium hominis]MCT7904362.1 hypothetical protein [Candidatus Ornithobacterium hominis]SZD73078.1 Uncharacterised protein [Candidatus Ornithobacterium hominis]
MKLSKFTKYIICFFLLLWIGEKSILAKVHTDNLEFSITHKFLVKQLDDAGNIITKEVSGDDLQNISKESIEKVIKTLHLDNLAEKLSWSKADITKLADNLEESIDLSQFTNKLDDLGDDYLEKFHYDYFKSSNAAELQGIIKNVDDLERWELLKKNPEDAFEGLLKDKVAGFVEATITSQKIAKNVWEEGTINRSTWHSTGEEAEEHPKWPSYAQFHPLIGGGTDGVIDEIVGIPIIFVVWIT